MYEKAECCGTLQAYPHMYVTSGLHDPRVPYWEPSKWVRTKRLAVASHACSPVLHDDLSSAHVKFMRVCMRIIT